MKKMNNVIMFQDAKSRIMQNHNQKKQQYDDLDKELFKRISKLSYAHKIEVRGYVTGIEKWE